MRQKVVGNDVTLSLQLPDGSVEIDGVSVHDLCRDQAEAGRADALVLEGAVANRTLPMEEGTAQGIACLALVGPGVAALGRARIGQPFQGKQRALNAAERS
jgi:hypothetical protein